MVVVVVDDDIMVKNLLMMIIEMKVLMNIVDVVINAKKIRKEFQYDRAMCHELGSEAGLTFSRFGGGYVDQK